MTAAPTLNSRLRILVAKAFKAEKLYSSVNNSKAERIGNVAALSEAVSDIRVREWQKSHYQLRIALNDILSLGNNSVILAEIAALRSRFLEVVKENTSAVERGSEELIDATNRHEFAHVFKLSLELIKCKAQAQASRVIVDELTSVIENTYRGDISSIEQAQSRFKQNKTTTAPAGVEEAAVSQSINSRSDQKSSRILTSVEGSGAERSNVIPLKRKMFGSRKSQG